MAHLITTQGLMAVDQLGMILPHEHIYVDTKALERLDDFFVDPVDVIALMAPEIIKAKTAGVTA